MDKNPKNQEDEEFEKLLRDFIDNDIDLDGDPEEDEETEDHDDQYDLNDTNAFLILNKAFKGILLHLEFFLCPPV